MRRVSIVAIALYVLVTLVAIIIFNYGQAVIALQASTPPGIPSVGNSTSLKNVTNNTGAIAQASPAIGIISADNSTSLRNFTNNTGGTNATLQPTH